MATAPKIQDYGAIGDGRSVALVSRWGSIDWLCWPRFDDPALFAGILDHDAGGFWSIAPADDCRTQRRYIDDTNVLETRFQTESGSLILTDFMPAASEEEKAGRLWPEQELIRRVDCDGGEIEVVARYNPRPDFGRAKVSVIDAGKLGLRTRWGAHLITLLSEVRWTLDDDGRGVSARFRLKAGESATFSLLYSTEGPAILPSVEELYAEKFELTIQWWRKWAARCRYDGPHRDEVVRSALALKLLSFAPSGAVVAAPTTSLPERVGGDLNWDYRFCWLRDASLTIRALLGLGYFEEADAFFSWMLHATQLTRPEIRVLYDVYGRKPEPEKSLDHLRGYADSRPVRVGNGAMGQLQLDMYGGVVEAASFFIQEGGELSADERRMLHDLASYARRHWREPDNGIWEPREERKHNTFSQTRCWVALDRVIKLHEDGRLPDVSMDGFADDRDEIRRDVEENCWNPNLQSYTQGRGGDTLDAVLLLMGLHGFEDPASDRMRGTYRQIQKRLRVGPGLIYRYEQSIPAGEGAFAISCFWVADFLARGGGTLDEARAWFKQTLTYANDLGLFAEEIDPKSGDALGNFPQAFTHVGLINAALSIVEREKQERGREAQDREEVGFDVSAESQHQEANR